MSDEKVSVQGEEAASAADPINNLKHEMNRKLSNYEQSMQQLAQSQEKLLAQLAALNKPAPVAPVAEDDIEKIWFDKPQLAKEKIKNEAKSEMRAEFAAQQAQQAKYQAVTNQLYTDFPELTRADSELMVKAQEFYKQLPEEDRNSPLAMKAAVLDAANYLGVKPASKRSADNDSFSLGSGQGAGKERAAKKGSDITPAMEHLAEAFGVDLKDPKVKERIKKQHGRKSYTAWDKPVKE